MNTKKALKWLLFWVTMALSFDLGVYILYGPQKALEFLGSYIIEQSLSMDNLFLFLMVFTSFGVPVKFQRRVLNYGIIGAVILRLIFVIMGSALINKFHWMLYVFGVILIYSGLKMIIKHEKAHGFENSIILRALNKVMPVSHELEGEKFITHKNGILYATPLFAILLLIEGTDIIFAIDSIPAIFSITTDPVIVYTSNIFAILGLRNLYFLLEKLSSACKYVKQGVALILTFTGAKLLLLVIDFEISVVFSLSIILSILALSILISVITLEKKYQGRQQDV